MAKNTSTALREQVIYSVYVRNHTPEGTFRAVIPDLDRIRALGTDIVWFMPIHPIGEKGKKGSLGCPYANRDYGTVNPEYGTLEDFKALVDAIHARGMKCIIDVVYNHTSPDAVYVTEHPEFYYRKPDGRFGNKTADWTDVIDLDYSCAALWDAQIQHLCYWAGIVDGFRCDVASLVPVEFWKKAREAVEKVHPGCIWLAESVHRSFLVFNRLRGITAATDNELYTAFDMEYEYDIRETFDKYIAGEQPLSAWMDMLGFQEAIYPENYVKLRYMENHDMPRIAGLVPDEKARRNFTALLYFLKGTVLLYGGQEYSCDHVPSLFDKDVFPRTGKDITLVGASKMNDAAACQEAIAAGIDALGENRVQEMTAKLAENAYAGRPLHFIGHLQRNKVRQVVGKADLIQSVGSAELLQEIEKAAGRLELCQDILLEVNIGGEAAKSGFSPDQIHAAAEMARALPHVQVRGLMTIPPVAAEPHGNLAYFEKMRWLYVDINAKIYDNKMEYLSMGMSGDFADAIRCGSNMIRVGTAIFGARDYTK